MNTLQTQFLLAAAAEAKKAGHIFPEMAACEAALESGYGTSELAREANNLFGMKQHRHMIYGTLPLPTREFQNGEWIQTVAVWVKYPDWTSCFADRMGTLNRLAPYLIHYRNALAAPTPEIYIAEVSKTWATDPARGAKVQAVYDECAGDWNATA